MYRDLPGIAILVTLGGSLKCNGVTHKMDEEELSPELQKDKKAYYASIFKKYDQDNSGYIEFKELKELLKSDDEVPRKIVKKVFKISDTNNDDRIDMNEFVNMLHNKKFKQLFGEYVDSYVKFIVPRHRRHLRGRRAGTVPDDFGAFEEQYSCWPPPIGMLLISIIEIVCFVVDETNDTNSTDYGKGITGQMFIYNPYKRFECWRYLTYMLVHIGKMHLIVNLLVQLMLGIALELVHHWWRVLLIYFAGVVAGSLTTSIADPNVFLAGASGGVYSIITAHIATIIMNWQEMAFPGVQLFIFILITSVDISSSIYNRYYLHINEQVSYAAHFGGGLAGLLVGIWILRNIEVTTKEKYIWWVAFVLYVLLMGTAVILNVVWTDHFKQ